MFTVEQKQILSQVLFLLVGAGSRKKQYRPADIVVPGFQVAQLDVMTLKKIKPYHKILDKFEPGLYKKLNEIFALDAEGRKEFLERKFTEDLAQMPDWWWQQYHMGLFLTVFAPATEQGVFYPSVADIFSGLIKTITSPASSIAQQISLEGNQKCTLVRILAQMMMPPRLIAKLIFFDEGVDRQELAIADLIRAFVNYSFYQSTRAVSLLPLQFFNYETLWLQTFIEVPKIGLSYQSLQHYPQFESEAIHQLSQRLSQLFVFLREGKTDDAVEALSDIRDTQMSLHPLYREQKIYLSPEPALRQQYMNCLRSPALLENMRWYLSHLFFSNPPHDDESGFIMSSNFLQELLSQLEQDRFVSFKPFFLLAPRWLQIFFSYVLLKALIKEPKKLIRFMRYLEQDIELKKDLLLKAELAFGFEREVQEQWLSGDKATKVDGEPSFVSFLDHPSLQEFKGDFLESGYRFFISKQRFAFIWFAWLQVVTTPEDVLRLIEHDNAEMNEWFHNYFSYFDNPQHAQLLDEVVATQLLISPLLPSLVHDNELAQVEELLRRIVLSSFKGVREKISELIRFCRHYEMANLILTIAFPSMEESERICLLLYSALQFNRPVVIAGYLRHFPDQQARKVHLNNLERFQKPFARLLFDMAINCEDDDSFVLPAAYQKLADALHDRIGLDLAPLAEKVLQMFLSMSSEAGIIVQPAIDEWLYELIGQMRVLPQTEQANFDLAYHHTSFVFYKKIFRIIQAFIGTVPDMIILRLLTDQFFPFFVELKDKESHRRFLLLIRFLINAMPFVPDKDLRLEQSAILQLVPFLFYQMHLLGFDDDFSLIEGIENASLRKGFMGAHILRLVLLNDEEKALQMMHHFGARFDYMSSIQQHFLCGMSVEEAKVLDALGQTDLLRRLELSSTLPLYLEARASGKIQFPIEQVDILSVAFHLARDAKRKGVAVRGLTRATMDPSSDAMINQKSMTAHLGKPSVDIHNSLAALLVMKSSVELVQQIMGLVDIDYLDESNRSALDVILYRFSFAVSEADQLMAAEIIKVLLSAGVMANWAREGAGSETVMTSRAAMMNFLKIVHPNLFGLLYEYLIRTFEAEDVVDVRSIDKARSVEAEILEIPVEQWVDAALSEIGNSKISVKRLVSIIRKQEIANEQDVKRFVRGYCLAHSLDSDLVEQKPVAEISPTERLKSSSYFHGEAVIQSERCFYPLTRGVNQRGFLYFDPHDIKDYKETDSFEKLLREDLKIVGARGEGLKFVKGLTITVAGEEFSHCYELKPHGTEERILCYRLEGDTENAPPIFVACCYLPEGFHTRLRPEKFKLRVGRPSFFQTPLQAAGLWQQPQKGDDGTSRTLKLKKG